MSYSTQELLDGQLRLIQDLQNRLAEYENGLWAVWLADGHDKPNELIGIYPSQRQANHEAAQWDSAVVLPWRMADKSLCPVWGKT